MQNKTMVRCHPKPTRLAKLSLKMPEGGKDGTQWDACTQLTGAPIRTTTLKSSSALQQTFYCSEIFAAPPCVKIILSALLLPSLAAGIFLKVRIQPTTYGCVPLPQDGQCPKQKLLSPPKSRSEITWDRVTVSLQQACNDIQKCTSVVWL